MIKLMYHLGHHEMKVMIYIRQYAYVAGEGDSFEPFHNVDHPLYFVMLFGGHTFILASAN